MSRMRFDVLRVLSSEQNSRKFRISEIERRLGVLWSGALRTHISNELTRLLNEGVIGVVSNPILGCSYYVVGDIAYKATN